MMVTNDIPLEAVLKYIKKDRDKYKDKLDEIVPYARSLENRIAELNEIIIAKDTAITELKKKIESLEEIRRQSYIIKQTQNEYDFMKKELRAFREDYRQTAWFAQLEADRKNLRESNKRLKMAFNQMLIKK